MALLQNLPVLFLLALVVGIVLGAGGYWMISVSPTSRVPQSEEDKKILDQINIIIDRRLTDKTTTVKDIASELNVNVRVVEKLFKNNYNESFQNCLNRSRIEVAKERLRSSNSSEATIAEQCGFKNTTEMARFFWRFYRTTPSRFRMEQQVT